MAIAIIISGQLRDFSDCYPSLQDNILDHNDFHIYLHTYADTPPDKLALAMELYRPHRLLVEKPIKRFSLCDGCSNQTPDRESMYWQYLNWKTVFQLVPNEYEYVLKVRYDIKYEKPVIISQFDPNHINIPMGGDFLGGLSDLVAFSSYSNMSHYCALVDHVNHYVNEQSINCHPETLLKHHLSEYKIARFDFPVYLRNVCMTGF